MISQYFWDFIDNVNLTIFCLHAFVVLVPLQVGQLPPNVFDILHILYGGQQ